MRRLWQAFWQRARYAWFLCFQRHRYDRLSLERVGDVAVVVLPQVFNPALFRTGQLLLQHARPYITPTTRVLDMGTGSGYGAVQCAKWGAEVVAVDINPHAVRCATLNALLNEVVITAHEGDLFAPLMHQQFDLVLFNPPFFDGIPKTPLDHAWRSVDVIPRFIHTLKHHLTPNGCALVVLSSKGNIPQFLHLCADADMEVTLLERRDALSEWVLVYRLWSKS